MRTQAAQAAAMIRKELKANRIKARVTSQNYSGGSSINVNVEVDLLPAGVAQLEGFCGQFQQGHFDGMTDCFEYSNRDEDLPQVKFVFVRVDYSDAVQQAAWNYVVARYGFENAPDSFKDADNYMLNDGSCNFGSYYLRMALIDDSEGFWTSRKQRVPA